MFGLNGPVEMSLLDLGLHSGWSLFCLRGVTAVGIKLRLERGRGEELYEDRDVSTSTFSSSAVGFGNPCNKVQLAARTMTSEACNEVRK